MRNVFDQYAQSENRLTHALASALHVDASLRAEFLKQYIPLRGRPRAERVRVNEQSFPGEQSLSDEEAEQAGVPDIWLYDEDAGWCCVIESKITSSLRARQLERHLIQARRRGFEIVVPVTITVRRLLNELPEGTIRLEWRNLYSWLISQSGKSHWASIAAEYFEALEARMIENGQLSEGTLTTFTGFPFQTADSYSYGEAKRLLRLALVELRKDERLVATTGMNAALPGRSAVTGRGDDAVWDFLQIGDPADSEAHTSRLHLTLGVHRRYLEAMVTLPHALDRAVRRNLTQLSFTEFAQLLQNVLSRMQPVIEREPLSAPTLRTVQRRYPTQRAIPFVDGLLTFDLRTGLVDSSKVKSQPEWLEAAYKSFVRKNSNLQMQIGMHFPFARCPLAGTYEALDLISRSWSACEPLFKVVYPAGWALQSVRNKREKARTEPGLGTRIASLFEGIGLKEREEIEEQRGYPARPIEFD